MVFILFILLDRWLPIVELTLGGRSALSILLWGYPRYIATIVQEVLVHVWQTRIVNWWDHLWSCQLIGNWRLLICFTWLRIADPGLRWQATSVLFSWATMTTFDNNLTSLALWAFSQAVFSMHRHAINVLADDCIPHQASIFATSQLSKTRIRLILIYKQPSELILMGCQSMTYNLVCIWVILPLISRYQVIWCTRNALSGILWMELRLIDKFIVWVESSSHHFLVMHLWRRQKLAITWETIVNSGFAFYLLTLHRFLGTM